MAEQLVQLDARFFSTSLNAARPPADAAERVRLAWVCQTPSRQLNAAAARLYAEAFAADPKLAADPGTSTRYNAACAAALAGCGRGKGADKLGDAERARLRQQALDWLRADLAAWRERLDQDGVKDNSVVRGKLKHWQQDADFEGVRRPGALADLPGAERQSWQKLWSDVAQTITTPEEKDSPKPK